MEAGQRKNGAHLAAQIFYLAFAFICASAPLSAQEMIPRNTDKIEERLAIINADRIVRADDITVARFRFLLSALAESSDESTNAIADKLVTGRRLLREKFGKDLGLLEFADAIYKTRMTIAKNKFSEHIASLVVIMGTQ